MSLGLTLRAFEPGDDRELISWFANPHELRMFAGESLRWPLDPRELRLIRADPTLRAWTAVVAGEVAGHIELNWLAQQGWGRLARVGLAPRLRGRGLGLALVDAALEQARAARMVGVDLRVYSENRAARATYAAAGFTDIGPDRSQPDLRWMVKKLEAGYAPETQRVRKERQ